MVKQIEPIMTVGIGGAAGDGIREAGSNLGILLNDVGFKTHFSFKYPSLIRGGHNYSRLSFSKEKIFYDYKKLDVLIALNEESVKRHLGELNKNAVILAENFDDEDKKVLGENAISLPLTEFITNIKAPSITRSSVALGALCYLLDLPLSNMTKIFNEIFRTKSPEINILLAEMGYKHLEGLNIKHSNLIAHELIDSPVAEFIDGNTAFARGLVAAGLNAYISYPMTPSSSILHFLASQGRNFKIKVIHPESEISSINMALGSVYAGKRVAVGTASGGFALMQEAFSLAGMAEVPLVVAVSQRHAPATGAPTHSSQSDLRFILHAGHGEFPRVVIAPGDPEESFRAGADALNLAWKYQLPVIVLLDKHVSENLMTSTINPKSVTIERGKILSSADSSYKRYALSKDGVSPLVFPGTPNAVVRFNSYEHDESGIATEEIPTIKAMQEKRFSKCTSLVHEFKNFETVKTYGDPKSKNVIVFWGSTKTVLLEAVKYLKKPVKILQILWLEPFDVASVSKNLKGAKKIINIESNHNGQLAGLIREKTGIEVSDSILRYDSSPLNPLELAENLNKLI